MTTELKPRVKRFTATLRPKGQITIPAEAREQLGIREGDSISVELEGKELRLKKTPTLEEISAFLTAQIKPGTPPLMDAKKFYQEKPYRW